MSKTIPFAPTTYFPVFGREWLMGIKIDMAAHSAMRARFSTFRNSGRFHSLTRWVRRRRLLRDESAIELARCRQELSILLFLKELLEEADRLAVTPSAAIEALAFTVVHIGQELIRRRRVCPGLTDDDLSSERQAATRADARKLIVAMGRSGPHIVAAISLHRWMAEWCETAADEDIDLIFFAIRERELLTSLQTHGLSAPEISVANLKEVKRRMASLEKQASTSASAYDEVLRRVGRVAKHVLAPMVESADVERTWGVATSLTLYDQIKCAATIELSAAATRLAENPALTVDELFLAAAARDPLFWYVGVSSLLRHSNAMMGNGLKQWAVELLAGTIKHPLKIRRASVPPEAMAARTVLAKWIAPILVGYHPDDRIADDILGHGTARSDQSLGIFASYLAGLGAAPDNEARYRDKHHRQTVEHLWLRLFEPNMASILGWIANGVDAAADIYVDQNQEQVSSEQQTHPAAEIVEPIAAEDLSISDGTPSTWFYVPNPAAGDLSMVPVEVPVDDGEDVFDDFLRSQGAVTQIKASSIMHALEYFLLMSPTQRAMTAYEDLGDQRWHKLKRGRVRIYVRVEPDGRLLFHPYARKDWRHDLVAFTGRAA